jgi:hypothetical protein
VAIDVQKADNFSPIKDMINHIEYGEVTKLRDSNCDTSKRVYNSPEWGVEYRSKLISYYEKKLYI